MKRKLVQFNEFEDIKKNSLSTVIEELTQAEELIAQKLGEDSVTLVSYNENKCIFESSDGTYVQANFSMDNNAIILEGIEKIVINEDSENERGLEILETVLQALIDEDNAKAEKAMSEYINLDITRQKRKKYNENVERSNELLNEDYKVRLYGTRGKGGRPKLFARKGSKDQAKSRAAKLGHVRHPSSYHVGASKRRSHLSKERSRRKLYKSSYGLLRAKSGGHQYTGKRKRMLAEWLRLTEHVYGFIDFHENGSGIMRSVLTENTDGTLDLTLPTAHKRNEGKILMMQYDLLKTDLKILRENARRLCRDGRFCQLVAEARKCNALSDDSALEDSLKNIANQYSDVLYVGQKELAKIVGEALNTAGVSSYDDEICVFLADGIQRTAVELYSDRVNRIIRASGIELKEEDVFDKYVAATTTLYPKLDESASLEKKMFEDLFNATSEVRKLAIECGNAEVKVDSENFLPELEDVIIGRQPVSLDLATEVANWLATISEGNLDGEEWTVDKTPYRTTSGEHPAMMKKARQTFSPSADGGHDTHGSELPVSNGKDYKSGKYADEMSKKGFGNVANKNTDPDLRNPLVMNSDKEWGMPNDVGVEKDNDNFGTWQKEADSVWPKLQNPMVLNPYLPHQLVDPSNSVE